MNVTKQIRIDKEELAKFERLYPDLLALFVNRAIFSVNRDSDLFRSIFLNPLLSDGLSLEV